MGSDVTGGCRREGTGLGKKSGRELKAGQVTVRLGGKHRSGNWPLVQARLEQKLRGKRGVLVTAFTLHILRRCLIGSPDF